jgi:streptomycin 6-kinase
MPSYGRLEHGFREEKDTCMSTDRDANVNSYMERWRLAQDGAAVQTPSSVLVPARRDEMPAMLKVVHGEEERRGAALMVWWDGEGAARVLAHEGDALLMERASGGASLIDFSLNGRDDEASRIICAAVARLHAPRNQAPPETLVPLERWFEALEPAATRHGGILRESAAAARQLLAEPQEVVVLHGDIHHGNILDFGEHGWLAIDPKGLLGERGFDYANTFCNPDYDIATAPGRLARQASIVAEVACLDRTRLLQWILAYAGLSAVWSMEDDGDPGLALEVAKIAAAELGNDCAPTGSERR